MSYHVYITCPKHIAPYLSQELTELGHPQHTVHTAGVEMLANLEDVMKFNLLLRCAHRVLLRVGEFEAAGPDDLYRESRRLAWEDWISVDGYFSVISSVDNESISNSQFAHQKLKDAIVDRMRQKFAKRPDSGPKTDRSVVFLFWKDSKCGVYMDMSGTPLSRRGYRVETHTAPMSEVLAAAVIRATEWDGVSGFINPMCGSGTLAIEAALKTSHIPSQWTRSNFGFMHTPFYAPDQWAAIRESAQKNIVPSQCTIVATDRDAGAIKVTRHNARVAGVADVLTTRIMDFQQTPVPEGDGIVFLNPPYGERMGDEKELEALYKNIGDWLKQQCSGKTAFIFSGSMSLLKHIGLRSEQRLPFYNADIECRLVRFNLYQGSRKIRQAEGESHESA